MYACMRYMHSRTIYLNTNLSYVPMCEYLHRLLYILMWGAEDHPLAWKQVPPLFQKQGTGECGKSGKITVPLL